MSETNPVRKPASTPEDCAVVACGISLERLKDLLLQCAEGLALTEAGSSNLRSAET